MLVSISLFGVCCFGAGLATHRYVFSRPQQRATYSRREAAAAPPIPARETAAQQERDRLLQQFNTIGYLSGYEAAPERVGVVQHDRTRALQALNFYTSGHALEAYLLDMNGEVRHTWQEELDGPPPPEAVSVEEPQVWWRRGYVYPNGDLLVIRENANLTKLDKHSNVIWKLEGGYHHDLQILEDGTIFVLTKRDDVRPYLHRKGTIDDDRIAVLTEDGEPIRELSILDAFKNSNFYAVPLRSRAQKDVLHTNTIEVLDGRFASQSDVFKRGNILLSCAYVDTIAVIDPEQGSVVWAVSGMWRFQHQPTLLENGNVLLFDNQGCRDDRARIIEFEPFTQSLAWSYMGLDGSGFESSHLGSVQRLANGNTLISDSVNGRAIEVTRDGEIVWEFINPARTGAEDELIAVVCEMLRLDPAFPTDWIPSPGQN